MRRSFLSKCVLVLGVACCAILEGCVGTQTRMNTHGEREVCQTMNWFPLAPSISQHVEVDQASCRVVREGHTL